MSTQELLDQNLERMRMLLGDLVRLGDEVRWRMERDPRLVLSQEGGRLLDALLRAKESLK